MFILRALVILFLVVTIFGGSAYFAYDLYWKPQQLDKEDKQTVRAAPTPPPDYTLPAFEKAVQRSKSGDLEGGRAALNDFIHSYPDSTKLAEARRILGELNSQSFFSPVASPDKVEYTVVSRDSLVRVATKFKSTPEIIFRLNNLETINLRIGQQLVIPQVTVSLVIDHKSKTVLVNNKGVFFREYPILSYKAPHSSTVVQAKVTDKVAMNDAKRVAFGDKDYAASDRYLMLGGGVILRGAPPEPGAPMPPGIVVASDHMDEIFLLANRGTPVTLQ